MAQCYTPNDYFLGKPTVARREITQMAKQAIPGYGGFKPNYMKGRSSPSPSDVASETSSVASEAMGPPRRSRSCGYIGGGYCGGGSPKVGERIRQAPPGYSGYIPGKRCGTGDHVGYRFTAATQRAVGEFSRRGQEAAEVPLTVDQLHGRVHVPGYSGHMPGVKSDTLVGTSPVRAAKEGWLAKNRERELGGGLVAY